MNAQEMLKSIANKLGLEADASPAMIVATIAEIQDKTEEAKERALGASYELEDVNRERKDLEKRYDELIVKSNELKLAAEKQTREFLERDAEQMVNEFAESGKIDDSKECIDAWVKLAKNSKENMELVRNMIAALPERTPVNEQPEMVNIFPVMGAVKNIHMRMSEIAKRHGR